SENGHGSETVSFPPDREGEGVHRFPVSRLYRETGTETPRSDGSLVFQDAREFADEDEAGASAILGDDENVVIGDNTDVLVYGDGGAGKTTLANALAVHLAAGDDWLGIPVPRPVRVGLVENEGPRPLFRRKLRRRFAGWSGSPLGDRLKMLKAPWGKVSLDV